MNLIANGRDAKLNVLNEFEEFKEIVFMTNKPLKNYPVAVKFFRSMFLMRCPECSHGDIYPNLFSIKPKDVCDSCDVRYERDSGVFIMPVFLCYFLGAAFAGLFGLFLGMRYGMFNGFTPTLIAATVVFIVLVYRPVKGFWIWMLWRFGLVRTDKEEL